MMEQYGLASFWEHEKWTLLVLAVVILIIIFSWEKDTRLTNEEAKVAGLSPWSKPGRWRMVVWLLLVIPGTIIIPGIMDANKDLSGFWVLMMYGLLFGVSFWILLGFGQKEAEQKWLQADKQERAKNVLLKVEADRVHALEQAEAERARQLAEDNATYAPLGKRTTTPEDITETARRVAEELKRG